MGNGRKKDTALWMVFVQGVALSLGVYLLVTVLASLLLVKAVLPEAGAFPVLAAGCCLSACLGGLTCTRRSPWGSLPSALVCAAGFLAVLIVVSLLCWKQISWLGRGGLLLLCGAGGGLLAGVLGGRRRRRKGGKRGRPVRKRKKSACEIHQKYRSVLLHLGDCRWFGTSTGGGAAAANIGAPPFLCLQHIVLFLSRKLPRRGMLYNVYIIQFT